MSKYEIQDLEARKKALDVTVSAIISAGAGAGKTGIIARRHLNCLLNVDKPEQVLSMTFTRDAASEMRHRIVQILIDAKTKPRPSNEYEQEGYDIAVKVLEKDRKNEWNIIENPHRLSIMTIDSLCAQIVRQVPILSGMGGDMQIAEDPFAIYNKASTRVIDKINDPESGLVDDVRSLLLYMHGNQQRCIDLISSMLAKRDQWMRHVIQSDSILDREKMKHVLESLLNEQVNKVCKLFGHQKDNISKLLDFAASNLPADHILSQGADEIGYWERAAELFLTKDNSVRKSVNKNLGFPAGADAKEAKELWKSVAEQIDEELAEALAKNKKLPSGLNDEQWGLLETFFRLLWQAVIELKVLFIEDGEVDFTEISQRALSVLTYDGDIENDIALKMFSWYRHILVDEVQDNNRTQYQFIAALVQEWDSSLGNTLFLVGDPKQSIYRFREADVGLFIQSQEYGIGSISFELLSLTSNFRSSDGIVNWNNEVYADSFPSNSDISMGAVKYTESTPVIEGKLKDPVTVVPLFENDDEKEAEEVIKAVKETLERNPSGDIAILVRARTHLDSIASALFDNKISYQAVEIQRLSSRQVIIDAISLSKSLTHAFDNTAWLALMRLPCVGLSLADITTLFENMGEDAVLERLYDNERISKLSGNGREKVDILKKCYEWSQAMLGTISIRNIIEGVWLQLGAPSGYSDRDIRDVQTFFGLLETYGFDTCIDFNQVSRQLDKLYAQPKFSEDTKVTLMTIHKAKGLEFETVIMPGLGKASRNSDSPLILWHEFTSYDSTEPELLVAPIKSTKDDPNYQYLMDMESEKDAYERARLMYVGTTRPKHKLYLLGHINQKDFGPALTLSKLKQPASKSCLAVIWDSVKEDFLTAALEKEVNDLEGNDDEVTVEPFYYKRVEKPNYPALEDRI